MDMIGRHTPIHLLRMRIILRLILVLFNHQTEAVVLVVFHSAALVLY